MDFWVLDLDGVPVVVDAWHQSDASADLVDQVDQARESITFVTGVGAALTGTSYADAVSSTTAPPWPPS